MSGLVVGDPRILNVEHESKTGHLQHLLMKTRIELRNRRHQRGVHYSAPQNSGLGGAAELGVALRKAESA
jgi:hypothetical protein